MTGKSKLILVASIVSLLCQSSMMSNAEPLAGDRLKSAEQTFPFSVLIVGKHKDSEREEHLCVGSLISKNQILTAASCLQSWDLVNVQAILSYAAGPNLRIKKRLDIASKVTYDDFVAQVKSEGRTLPPRLNDIAILRLYIEDTGVTPVTVSYSSDLPALGSDVKIVGFGRQELLDEPAELKKYGTTNVLKKQLCYEKAKTVTPIYKKFIWSNHLYCVQGPVFVLAVDGDFGGPAIGKNGELIGITFRGRPRTEEIRAMRFRQPNLILNIGFYKDFLEKYITS